MFKFTSGWYIRIRRRAWLAHWTPVYRMSFNLPRRLESVVGAIHWLGGSEWLVNSSSAYPTGVELTTPYALLNVYATRMSEQNSLQPVLEEYV